MGMFIALITLAVSWLISNTLKSKFRQYSRTPLRSNLSGKEIAESMLTDHGIYDVRVFSVEGQLTDHYNPANRTVNLSHEVYTGRNAAAAAVAAHECGHAVQHAKAYSFLQFRSSLVPVLSITSNFMPWVIKIGAILLSSTGNPTVLTIGVALFALTTLFAFITLPVEFDASRRALAWMDSRGVVTNQEHTMAKDALWWAAMTYVVAAIGSLGQLIYYISLLSGSGRRND
jgi:Zn-dependent membrane protease YugP